MGWCRGGWHLVLHNEGDALQQPQPRHHVVLPQLGGLHKFAKVVALPCMCLALAHLTYLWLLWLSEFSSTVNMLRSAELQGHSTDTAVLSGCVLGPQSWVWDELKGIADMRFRFLEEEDSCDLVTRLASSMGWVAPEHLLVADYLHTQWQPDQVRHTGCCRGVGMFTQAYMDGHFGIDSVPIRHPTFIAGLTWFIVTRPLQA